MTLVERLRAMMEAPIRLPGEVDTLDAAIARIEALSGAWADAENAVRALEIACPLWVTGTDDMHYTMKSADYTIALNAALKLRDLVREQEGTDA